MALRTGGAWENCDVITEQAHGRLFMAYRYFSPMSENANSHQLVQGIVAEVLRPT